MLVDSLTFVVFLCHFAILVVMLKDNSMFSVACYKVDRDENYART